jgi:hypothetical protein
VLLGSSPAAAEGALLPPASLVVDAIVEPHPSAAAVSAFKTAFALATSNQHSLAHGAARLVIGLAAAVGVRLLGPELHVNGALTLGGEKATIPAKAKRKLAIVQTALQARITRLLAIYRSSHSVRLTVTLTSTQGGKTRTSSKSFSVP